MTNYWSTISERRFNRRRALATTGATAAGAALLAACGGGSSDSKSKGPKDNSGLLTSPEDTSKQAKRGGIVKWFLSEPTSLDPQTVDDPTLNTPKTLAYSPMIIEKPGYLANPEFKDFLPYMAESWEWSPDHLQLTMKIRPNVKFHNKSPVNGRTMDMQDVIFSFERFASKGAFRSYLFSSVNPTAPIASFSATDSRTLVIKMTAPSVNFLSLLANANSGRLCVMPKEADSAFDPRHEMIGTGPWTLEKYTPSSSMTWKRHAGHFEDRPYVDGLEAPFITDYAVGLAQLKAGNLYYYGTAGTAPIRPQDVLNLKKEVPALNLYANKTAGFAVGAIKFGALPAGQSPFRDERVRQAFSHALDRDLWIDTFYGVSLYKDAGLEVPTYWHNALAIGSGAWWLDPRGKDQGPNSKYFQYDVAEGKKLLAAAGYSNGITLKGYRPNPGRQGPTAPLYYAAMDQMAADVGFKIESTEVDFITQWVPKYRDGRGNHDGFTYSQGPSPANDPVSFFQYRYYSKGNSVGFLGYDKNGKGDFSGDPDVDSMIEKSMVEFDNEKRRSIVNDLQRYLSKPMYGINFPGEADFYFVAWPCLRNFQVERNDQARSGNHPWHGPFNWWLDDTQPPLKKT